jgi:hypothetical protein
MQWLKFMISKIFSGDEFKTVSGGVLIIRVYALIRLFQITFLFRDGDMDFLLDKAVIVKLLEAGSPKTGTNIYKSWYPGNQ